MWPEALEQFEKITQQEPTTPEMLHLLVLAATNDAENGSRDVAAVALAAWIDGCEVVAGTLERLIQTLSQQGHVNLALETLEEINQHDQQTDASTLESGLLIKGGISSAQGSTRVYAALLKGCVVTQNTKGARAVVDAMRSHGVWDRWGETLFWMQWFYQDRLRTTVRKNSAQRMDGVFTSFQQRALGDLLLQGL